MPTIGLTGNFGMGKSTVAQMFKALGAITLDTDEIVRELLTTTDVIEKIQDMFGDDIARGGIVDKKALAESIFSYPHLRIALEDILHPKVFARIDAEVARILAENPGAVIIIEAPVIFERGYQNKFDYVITVFTSEEIARQRLQKKGTSEDEIARRLASQFPIGMKKSKADFSIDNSGDLNSTRTQVENIYHRLCGC